MTDPIVLRNRFAMVKGAWDEELVYAILEDEWRLQTTR